VRVLVTGGAGFIGSHVVDRLRAHGVVPRIFDVRPSPYHAADEVEAVTGDLLDPEALEAALARCDAVVHLAAAADVDDVARRPADAERVNARGTLNVLEAARRRGVTRVVFASTIWVYGNGDAPVDEETAVAPPDHLYTATKLAGEMYCRAYARLYGLDCTILRLGIPYGPRSRPTGVLPVFVRRAQAGEPLTIAGEGSQSRRFVYVEDLAEGVVAALGPQATGRVYNLVGDESVSVRGIADTVCELVADVGVVQTPARAADFAGAEVSGARAAAELDWRPTTTFPEGVRRYVAWVDAEAAREAEAVRAVPATRRRPSLRPGPALVSAALNCLAIGVVAGVLLAYLSAIHAVGLGRHDEHTVGVLSLAGLAAYLALRLDGARRPRLTFAAWLTSAALVVIVVMDELREQLGLGSPDPPIVLLSMAGAALAIACADAAVRLRRTDHEPLPADPGG